MNLLKIFFVAAFALKAPLVKATDLQSCNDNCWRTYAHFDENLNAWVINSGNTLEQLQACINKCAEQPKCEAETLAQACGTSDYRSALPGVFGD